MKQRATILLMGVALATPLTGEAQPTTCATCHLQTTDLVKYDHLLEWEESTHGREQVGCQSCHGGDPDAPDLIDAHREVLSRWNPASPVHPTNVLSTCGGCHAGPLESFEESRHFELFSAGDERGPTCRTCHGSSGARLPTANGLERRCESCHGPDGPIPRPGRAQQGGATLERIIQARRALVAANRIIERIQNPMRQLTFMQEVDLIDNLMREAADSFHRFVFDDVETELLDTQERIDQLMDQLANTEPPPVR